MAKLVRLTAELRENFVAYLDGELPEDDSRKVEQALATNEVARHEMESLARTWELIDSLPREKATENFTQKTMATLTIQQPVVPLAEKPIVKKAKHVALVIGWIAGLAGTAVAGFLVTHSLIPLPTDELVHELPVIENLDRYQEVETLDFLKRLQSERVWITRPGKGKSK